MNFKKTPSFQYRFQKQKTPCNKSLRLLFCSVGFSFIFFGCSTTKNVTYFKDLTDTSKVYTEVINGTYEVQIQPDDILEIIVNSINADAAAPFNLGNTNPAAVPGSQIIQNTTGVRINPVTTTGETNKGYLVDKDGAIDFPVLGNMQVKGLTIRQLKDLLKTKLDKYLQEPIVNVRLLNYKITVLGEVLHPSTYSIPSERITVIDAIGIAGDLTIYGKRENVLLIREENGIRKFVRLNLNSSKIFESPYYYLKQNDVIYIEPNKSRIAAADIAQIKNISIATSVISLIIVIISRLK